MIVMAGSGKRVAGTLFFLIALVAVLAFYFIMFADAQQVDAVPGTGELPLVAVVVAILLLVVAIVLIILLVTRGSRRRDDDFFVPDEVTPAFEEVDDDLVVYDVWRLPVSARGWGGLEDERTHAYYFPVNVETGVYVNDYLDIGKGQRLKMRTLLAGPADIQAAAFIIPQHNSWQAQPAAPAPAPAEEPASLPGDDFMSELESRFEERRGRAEPAVAFADDDSVYYDYRGDDHRVIDVEGIGSVYAAKLQQAGILTTARLCYEEASSIAAQVGAPEKTVRQWQVMAELMKVSGIGPQYAEALARAGIDGIDELKRRSAERLAKQVNDYLASVDQTVTKGTVSERRIAGWQAAAQSMRRLRQEVPAQ